MNPVYPHVQTSADLLNSTVRLESLIPFLLEQKATAVAITNRRMYGTLPFYQSMKKAGIHPVIGLSCDIEFSETIKLPIQVYAKTNRGYQNLLKISSSLEVKGLLQLPMNWLQAYKEDCVIILSIPDTEDWSENQIEEVLSEMKRLFSTDLFAGIERPGGVVSSRENFIISTSKQHEIEIMATHNVKYERAEHAFSYEVAQAIAHGVKLQDSARIKPLHTNSYMPSAQEWIEWFSDQPQWLQTSENLLHSCLVNIPLHKMHMPAFPVTPPLTSAELLKSQCLNGISQRLENVTQDYLDRLGMELSIINQMGYADYFLIVADFMAYAKEKKILTGPGRGSSASSLVAFSLFITHVDPLKFGLLFERFLNPERITMPDIDIDFVDNRRQEVIQYVAQKYGQAHVA
ncbi:MAG: PHP domain-containing protein, partial [Paenisporosarcina sp.]